MEQVVRRCHALSSAERRLDNFTYILRATSAPRLQVCLWEEWMDEILCECTLFMMASTLTIIQILALYKTGTRMRGILFLVLPLSAILLKRVHLPFSMEMPVSIKNGLHPSSTATRPFDYWSLRRRPPPQPQAIRVTPPSTKPPPSSLIIACTRRRPSLYTDPSHARVQVLRTLSSPLLQSNVSMRPSTTLPSFQPLRACLCTVPLCARSLLSSQHADCERAHSVCTSVKPLV